VPRYETLGYDEREGVATVTLNRPEVHNAFDTRMLEDLRSCWHDLRANDAVNAIVLTGAGDKAFCTGVDRNDTPAGGNENSVLATRGNTPLHIDDPGDWISPKTSAELWKPMIAAVNGMACAGAFYLLGQVEFIIASESATFFDPHTTFGMAAVFEPMAMLQRMPLGEIMRMAIVGNSERMSAKRAYDIGLVQQIVPPDQLLDAAQEVAAKIAAQPPLAVQTTVRAVWYAQELGYRQALDVARTLIQLGTDNESLRQGEEAFRSGRRQPWTLR
jgi:enoyl-CoA hydratase/carnithine racemase